MRVEWQENFSTLTASHSFSVVRDGKWFALLCYSVPTEHHVVQNENIWSLLMHSLLAEILQNDQPAYI